MGGDGDSMLAETVRRFALERVLPETGRWKKERYPRERIRELGDLGLLGVRVPEQYGGSDGTLTDLGIISEELGRGDFSVCYFPQLATIAAELLKRADESLRERWLPPLASGEAVIAYALTEPGVGSDAANLSARLRREGDEWVLDGEKSSITFAGFADAAVVFARSGGPGARGVSAVFVPLDAPGVTRTVYDSTASPLCERGSLIFDGVRLPLDHQIGTEGTGFVSAMQSLDFNRAFIALSAVGCAMQSLDETIAYTKERHTFGQPLAKREGVSFQIAEHLAILRAVRALAYETLAKADAGNPYVAEGAMVKWLGPKCAVEAIHTSMILHGWIGYSTELPLDGRLRDVMGLEVGDGTPEIMKGIIAREAMGREFVSYR
jgi:cyclohexanecarboxyl-CoA dehydrogenase